MLVSDFVLNLDLAPTILDFAGVPVPEEMQGASMKRLLLGSRPAKWRQSLYYHYKSGFGVPSHYGIRTKAGYKLIHYYRPQAKGQKAAWELFSLAQDPHEMKNLYHSPEHQDLIRSLKGELRALQQQYQDRVSVSH